MSVANDSILVTALGVVSPIGVEDFPAALYQGHSGLAPSESIPGEPVVGEVRGFDPKPWLGKKGVRVLDRCARLLAVSSHIALRESGLLADDDGGAHDVGLVVGTMVSGLSSIVNFDWSGVTDGPSYVSPMQFANTVINAPAGQTAIKHRLRGLNSTICNGQGSGLSAIQYAAQGIALGRAKALLAGGSEELGLQTYEGLAANGLLSASGVSKPFGSGRDGLVPGEASASLLLESAEHAAARGRQGIVSVAGYAAAQDSSSAEGLGYPDPELVARTFAAALAKAGVDPSDVACIVTSGCGSPSGDAVEAKALQQVFGSALERIPAYAPKAALGESFGASGAIAAAAAAIALREQRLPPTVGAASLDYALSIRNDEQRLQGEHALICSVGFYGDCAALALRKCQ